MPSITLSVLDRLIDEDLKLPGKLLTRSEALRKLRDAVRRDLEWLLNTRQPVEAAPEGTELHNSLYMYGLPDITSMSIKNTADRQRLLQEIQAAVARFEPRISNVRVSLKEDKMPNVRFIIEGLLRVDPSPEHVSFDTVLQLSNGEYTVRGDAGAR
jgi:type VI secretion system protein ImpF